MLLTYLVYDRFSRSEVLLQEEVLRAPPTIKRCPACGRYQVPGFDWGNHPELNAVGQEYIQCICPRCNRNTD